MKPGGSFPHKTTILLLLALCLLGWNSRVAVSADFGQESSPSPDQFPILTHGVAAVYALQALGFASPLSDFDGDHKVDVAVGRRIGKDYVIVIHLTSRPDETVLESSHLLPGLTVFAYDINRDSFSDIVVANPFEVHPLAVWLGDGKGGFSAADQMRFAIGFGLSTSPSYDRQCLTFQQDLLAESLRLDCENKVSLFEDLRPEPKWFASYEVFPHLQRRVHSLLVPRSPPDYLPL